MDVYLSRVHFPVTTLGPGRRLGIWFQGCSIRCAGCISMDTWAIGRGRINLDSLVTSIEEWLREADGITVTGGEPFDQPDALRQLLGEIRARTSADILVFSGYAFENLDIASFDGLIDALISEPYLEATTQKLALRGSDNQRLHFLTQKGTDRFTPFARARCKRDDRLDLFVDDDGTAWMAGIPKRGDLARLVEDLRSLGHEDHATHDARTSADEDVS